MDPKDTILQNYLTLAVQGDFRLHLEKGLILGIKQVVSNTNINRSATAKYEKLSSCCAIPLNLVINTIRVSGMTQYESRFSRFVPKKS